MSVLFPDDIEANIASIKNSKLDTSLLSQREQSVLDAKLEKVNFLEKARVIEKRNQLESAAGRMGFDHKGLVVEHVNRMASSVNDVARFASNLLQLPDDANAYYQAATTDPWANLAQIEENKGTESERNRRLLDQKVKDRKSTRLNSSH